MHTDVIKRMAYTRDQLSSILEEISGFEVALVDDPTLPQYGLRYLTERISTCRKYLNRVIFYMQTVGKQVKDLTIETRQMELDLELKTAQKLADDPVVKKQPSIEDRKALALMMLREEHDNLSVLKVDLLDALETFKIIKMKHQDLVRTNADIKSQRQLVKDDIDTQMAGGKGYSKPQARQDRSIPDGMSPPVVQGRIDPKDLLDPDKRPEDMPVPVDEMHAQQISEFFGFRNLEQAGPALAEDESETESSKPKEYDDDGVELVDSVASFNDI